MLGSGDIIPIIGNQKDKKLENDKDARFLCVSMGPM